MNLISFIIHEGLNDLICGDPDVIEEISVALVALHEELVRPVNLAGNISTDGHKQLVIMDHFCQAICGLPIAEAISQCEALGHH